MKKKVPSVPCASDNPQRGALAGTAGSAIPDDFGTKLPALPIGGPRALTEKDLKGYTAAQWKDIEESESERAYVAGVRRKGWLAHRQGKPRQSPYVPGKYTAAWFTGYDEFSQNAC